MNNDFSYWTDGMVFYPNTSTNNFNYFANGTVFMNYDKTQVISNFGAYLLMEMVN